MPDPARKPELRRLAWAALRKARAARFPGVEGRVPNFVGAEQAARLITSLPAWKRAGTLACNPDLPQRALRHAALREGKRVYLAIPRLKEAFPFVLLDPDRLDPADLWKASSIQGGLELGTPVFVAELDPVDLVVAGSVAVAPDGARLGKGGGYCDLAYALLREHGLATARTQVLTTAHPAQVLRRGQIPMVSHDVAVDAYATPDGVVPCPRKHRRPQGVRWQDLEDVEWAMNPVLANLVMRGGRPYESRGEPPTGDGTSPASGRLRTTKRKKTVSSDKRSTKRSKRNGTKRGQRRAPTRPAS